MATKRTKLTVLAVLTAVTVSPVRVVVRDLLVDNPRFRSFYSRTRSRSDVSPLLTIY
jgi:hypothetical protein